MTSIEQSPLVCGYEKEHSVAFSQALLACEPTHPDEITVNNLRVVPGAGKDFLYDAGRKSEITHTRRF